MLRRTFRPAQVFGASAVVAPTSNPTISAPGEKEFEFKLRRYASDGAAVLELETRCSPRSSSRVTPPTLSSKSHENLFSNAVRAKNIASRCVPRAFQVYREIPIISLDVNRVFATHVRTSTWYLTHLQFMQIAIHSAKLITD